MHSDPIADYLTRVRNAVSAGHRVVEIPASNIKQEITKVLKDQSFIIDYKFEKKEVNSIIKIALKYDQVSRTSAIRSLDRVSTPGLRRYSKCSELPRVMNGLGIAIVSTSKGVMTDKQARKENIGGEVLCFVQ